MSTTDQTHLQAIRRRSQRSLLLLALLASLVLAVTIIQGSHARWVRAFYASALGAELLPDDGIELQKGRSDCGPAALEHVLKMSGLSVDVGRVHPPPGGERWGVSAGTLAAMSRRAGLAADVRAVDIDAIDRVVLPVIAVLGTHFVVIEAHAGPDAFRVFDPSLGRLKLPRRSLANDWRGVVIAFSSERRSFE